MNDLPQQGPQSVPTNVLDAEQVTPAEEARRDAEREDLEARLLTAEAALRELAAKEAGQRHSIRWIAVAVGLFVIAAMLLLLTTAILTLLCHTLRWVTWFPWFVPPPAFVIVIVAAPIVSITTITIALFVGAFKKFEDKDAEHAANGITAGINMFKG